MWIFLIRLFSTVANLVVILYYSHHIPLDSYGSYQSFWVYLMVLSTIACAGLGVLAYTYSLSTIRQILSGLKARHYILYAVFSLLCGGVFFLLLNREAATGKESLTFFSLVYFLCYSWNVILEAILTIARRFRLLAITSLLHSLCFVAVHYYAAAGTFSLNKLLTGLALLSVLRFATLLPPAIKAVVQSDPQAAKQVHRKRIGSMWLSLLTYDTTQILFRFLDKFIITFLVTKELAAIYMNGTIDIPFLPVFFAAVGNAALLQLTKSGSRDKHFTRAIIRQSSVNMATITIPLLCYLFIFREELIRFVFSEKYMAATPIFTIAVLKLLTYLFTLPFYLQYRQRGDLLNKGAVIDMVSSLLLIYPLYHWLGLNGMILSFVISSLLQVLYYSWCAARLLRVSPAALLPLGNWGIKAACFVTATLLCHQLCIRLGNTTAALAACGGILAALSLLWLFLEYKRAGITTFAAGSKTD